MKVVLASNNQNKVREMRAILTPLGWDIVTQADVGLHLEPEETGTTFEENAKIKAVAVMEASGLPAIADDSGIAVNALSGEPGVYSARYGGDACKTDQERNDLLLKNTAGVPDAMRGAKFVSVIAMAFPDGRTILARGECYGMLLRKAQGGGGFGYDPLFYMPSEGCTMAELSSERKNKVSHRARALRDFIREIGSIDATG